MLSGKQQQIGRSQRKEEKVIMGAGENYFRVMMNKLKLKYFS